MWLDPSLTSPYRFYQFWINADDADLPKYLRYFSLKSKQEIESLENAYADNPRELKALLAEELTRRVHSDEDFEAVVQVSEILFGRTQNPSALQELTLAQLEIIAEEIPSASIAGSALREGINIAELLAHTTIVPSRNEARKAIGNNAISVNKVKVTTFEHLLTAADLLHQKYILIENGKKNKHMLIMEGL